MSEILSRKQIDRDYYWNEGYAAGLAAADERARGLVEALGELAIECETPLPDDPNDWMCDSRVVARRIRAILRRHGKE